MPVETDCQSAESSATRREDDWSWSVQAPCVWVCLSCLNYWLWLANFMGDYLRMVMMHSGWSCLRY